MLRWSRNVRTNHLKGNRRGRSEKRKKGVLGSRVYGEIKADLGGFEKKESQKKKTGWVWARSMTIESEASQ